MVDLPRRHRVPALVRDRHVPRHGRGLAPRRLRRHGRDADADGAALVPGVLPQPARGLLPRLQARVVPDPARLLDRRGARRGRGTSRRRVPPRAAADPRRDRAQRRRLDARDAQRDDHDRPGGLRRDGAGQGPTRPQGQTATRRATRSCRRSRPSRPSSRAPSAGSSSSRSCSATPASGSRCSRRRSATTTRVVQALLLVISFCVLLANFIMDCVYVVLDPRVRAS